MVKIFKWEFLDQMKMIEWPLQMLKPLENYSNGKWVKCLQDVLDFEPTQQNIFVGKVNTKKWHWISSLADCVDDLVGRTSVSQDNQVYWDT